MPLAPTPPDDPQDLPDALSSIEDVLTTGAPALNSLKGLALNAEASGANTPGLHGASTEQFDQVLATKPQASTEDNLIEEQAIGQAQAHPVKLSADPVANTPINSKDQTLVMKADKETLIAGIGSFMPAMQGLVLEPCEETLEPSSVESSRLLGLPAVLSPVAPKGELTMEHQANPVEVKMNEAHTGDALTKDKEGPPINNVPVSSTNKGSDPSSTMTTSTQVLAHPPAFSD